MRFAASFAALKKEQPLVAVLLVELLIFRNNVHLLSFSVTIKVLPISPPLYREVLIV